MSALYQRARPATFDEVVGQRHVMDVLGSAVARGMTGHAYLFSGPRGVGKTTTARLMAMAVNCEMEDPADRPCGKCESCQLVREGAHPDVMELDAASNNSVDDVRALREQVGLASLRGGTRVWILDEAHMLSKPAANALLKTLEEPPPGLMFLLATTEPEKLPPTILSRCQHFRFRRLTDSEILGKLERLCQEAGVEADHGALSLVARAADGAMRDAESLLERLLVAGGKVTAADAEDALGLPPRDRLSALAHALVESDLGAALGTAGDLYGAGFAPRTVAEQLGRTLRDMLHASLTSADGSDRARLVRLIHALDDEHERFVRNDDLYALEVALIKATNAGAQPSAAAPPDAPPAAVPRASVAAASRTAKGTAQGAEPTADAPPRDEDPSGGKPTGAEEPAPASASETGHGKPFSWHAVRTAAAPQIKAFLQPAKVQEEGGVVTLEFEESWRFHFDQVVARREELETLIEKVAGPGYVVELRGPRGSSGGGRGNRGRKDDGARATRQGRAEPTRAPPAAPGSATTDEPPPHGAAEPVPSGRPDANASDSATEPHPSSLHDELPEGFWDADAAPDGAVPGADEPAEKGDRGDAGGDDDAISRLQSLFPGRVVEFVPHARAVDDEAAPLPPDEEGEGYDDDGQDRLGFGAATRREG